MNSPYIHQYKTPFWYALVLIVGMFLGYKLSDSIGKQIKNPIVADRNLDDLIYLISDKYVDTVDIDHLYDDGVEGILSNLDPHTVYIPKSDLNRVNEELEGSFYGIGVEFFIYKDTVRISSILDQGPCYNTNISPGDRIIKINDSLVAGKQITDERIIEKIRGELNSPVTLTVLHPNQQQESITIQRNAIPIKSVLASVKVNPSTGYILIKMFSENTYDEFKTALQDLIKKGINNLIIDVRDNPGGYMDAVANIADEMISGDHTIIQTKGKNREDELRTHIDGQFENGKVVILVNENSASASEILAGVIQDLDRGIVVGRRTYGKGLVQEQFVLPDRSAIRITTARYYLPSGRCIQRSYKNGKANYKKDIFNRFEHGELTNSDSTNHTNLQDTFYTTSKKIVFGNEGITPNYFVSLDTSQAQSLNSFYETHLASGFTSSYYYANKNEFNTYTTAEVFAKDFALTHKQLDALKLYVHSLGFSNSMSNFYLNSSKIQSIIKAEFAKLQFGYNGYFASLAQQDEMILKAISLLAQ